VIILKRNPEIVLPFSAKQEGWYNISKYKADQNGEPILGTEESTGWFPNLITNQGLNRLGTALDVTNACQVGSGSAVPQFTDTGLQTFVAGSNTIQASTAGAQASSPYYAFQTRTYRFAAGTATGNLSEVGVGWATTGANLFSRALIVDGSGNPITITVLPTEVLDVTYQIRNYPQVTDTNSNITITGVGTRNLLTRACLVTSNTFWRAFGVGGITSSSVPNIAYAGSIGDITGQPTGLNDTASATANAAYSNGSYQRTSSATWDLNRGNLAGGIRSIRLCFGADGSSTIFSCYQCEFDAAINKLNTQTFTLNTLFNWGRL
jgi:hypothetical protein